MNLRCSKPVHTARHPSGRSSALMSHPMKPLLMVLAAILTFAASPAAAQDAPLVVQLSYDPMLNSRPVEGSSGHLYRVKIKNGVAPKGGLTVRVSWLLTASGTTGSAIGGRGAVGDKVTIPEGMNESEFFASPLPIPDDGDFEPCNKVITMLHSINPAVYRIAPMRQGEGYHSAVYNDASNGMQSPGCR